MKKSQLQEVTCPHCQNTQGEPVGVISTNCRACGRYFKLGARVEARASRLPKDTREVTCVKCGAPNMVAAAALSTQCNRCLHYLELGDKVIKGVQTGKLYAYDDVLFAEGCSFKGMEATGRRMTVRGKVFSRLRAVEEIVATAGSQISGELYAPLVQVDRGAVVKVQAIECARLMVSGEVEISGVMTVSEIVLREGAVFTSRLDLGGAKLTLEKGVLARFDAITCEELIVEGEIKLDSILTTSKVTVLAGGTLIAPVIRAARIEVLAGGSLQGRIERYAPREAAPVPEPEPSPAPEPERAPPVEAV